MHHQRSTAKFTCPSCHKYAVTEVPVPEPDWGALSDDLSDMTREESTHVTCNHCSVGQAQALRLLAPAEQRRQPLSSRFGCDTVA